MAVHAGMHICTSNACIRILSICTGKNWETHRFEELAGGGPSFAVQEPCSLVTGNDAWGGSWQEVMEGRRQVPSPPWLGSLTADCKVQLLREKPSAVVWGLLKGRLSKANKCAFPRKGKAERCCHSRWAEAGETQPVP